MNYDELLSPAAKQMRPSGIRKFFDLAADMPHCISLGVGEPDFKTPWSVRDAGIRSLEQGRTKYTANAGLKELRAEVCNYLARRFELNYEPQNVLVTVGGSEAIDLAIRALVKPGDEVIIPEPCFVCYEPITQLVGGVPVHIATRAEDEFRLTAEQLKAAITPRTKLLIFPYPNNPTGAVMSAADMLTIAEVLRDTNIMVLSDEIYSELTYGLDRHVSFASLPGMAERTIVVNGFSKSYAMTGWRIGYAAANAEIAKAMSNYLSHSTGSPCSISQQAALAAFGESQEPSYEMKKAFDERRKYFYERVQNIPGVSCLMPEGAFYIFMNIKELLGKTIKGIKINNSNDFASAFLEKGLVAVVPGSAFGADGYVRWSYATSMENIKEGLDRLEKFLAD